MTAVTVLPDNTPNPKVKKRGFFRRMFRNEGMRPRRPNNNSWVGALNQIKNSSTLFSIGECDVKEHRVNMSQGTESKSIKKIEREQNNKVLKKCLNQFENYCGNSTLHGLKYVGDANLTLGERIFWLIAFIIAAIFAGYYIADIYKKWNTSPVIISFSPFDADLTNIPFPALTICNMNQVKRSEAEKILKEGTDIEKSIVYDICNKDSITNVTTSETKWETLRDVLTRVGSSCENMLKLCKWRSEIVSCEATFNNDLTDEGLCCSFNRLPDNKIYRNTKEIGILNRSYPDKVFDWSPEHGFDQPETGDDSIPRRPLGAGSHLGLSIVLDAQISEYFCSSTSSVGFKILMGNPLETPKMADYGFLLSPGTETRFAIYPSIREASQSLRYIDIEKRQCYFESERPLKYYRHYTSKNCRTECLSNYTYASCKCVPYHLPRSSFMKICDNTDDDCAVLAKANMELTYGKAKSCKCYPGCFELVFTRTSSHAVTNEYTKLPKHINATHKYFATYTKRNCYLECQANYTLFNCGCVPYYLPKSPPTKVCHDDKDECVAWSKRNMQQTNGNATSCHCYPGCTEVEFSMSKSSSDLSDIFVMKEYFDLGLLSADTLAVGHFFFQASKITKQVKSTLYGFTDILSNLGGLLGLCMGFSFLSVIEIVYFITLRVCCTYFKEQRKHRIKQRSKYPFVK